jgi:hypothetical protein
MASNNAGSLLATYGLCRLGVPADGNCLFHSLAFFIKDPTLDHLSLRRRLCAFIAAHPDHFASIVVDSPHRSLSEYLSLMSRPGVFGDGSCIDAFSLLFGLNVVIFNDDQCYETLPDAEINIALYWDRRRGHYEPAIPRSSPLLLQHI